MLIANKSKQRKFFDNARYRFPTLKIFNPLLQHRLELLHIKKHLTIDPPKNICDFGSGSGRLTIPLLQMGFHVHAVDISVQSLHALKKAYESNKTKSWGKLTLSSTLPENTLFDAIFGSD
ncbi:methyltransferase domain-containing protein, partial [Candidatus Gottesmanbacteria bacterium]|nr:methyltransferase domain-containing protein [Candidatus Gottesmanbacteria bacterium]